MPEDELPADIDCHLLTLNDRARLETGKVFEVGRVEQRVREVLADKQARDELRVGWWPGRKLADRLR
jgi:hypothetical protein